MKSAELNYKEKYEMIHQHRKEVHVKVTKLMILCFLFEFTTRWVVQAMDSRLASYMNWKFGFTAISYSLLSCSTGVVSFCEQAFLYSFLVQKCNVPIVYLALLGATLETIAYWIIAASRNLVFTIIGVLILVMGYCFSTTTSASIISTTNPAEVQGKVLSWNNLCQQISYVVTPLVLSAVYTANPNATYYSCMIVSGICFFDMLYIISLPNSRLFGKVNVLELKGNNELPVKKDIEKKDSPSEMVTIPNADASTNEPVSTASNVDSPVIVTDAPLTNPPSV